VDEEKDGFSHHEFKIVADLKKEEQKLKEVEKVEPSSTGFGWGGLFGGLLAGTVSIIAAPLALVTVGAALAATAIAGVAGGVVGAIADADVTYKTIVSEVWSEKT
jgi:hypothetical protein